MLLEEERSTSNTQKKSAEGIVGIKQAKLVRHSKSPKGGETDRLSCKADTEGLNGV